MKIKRLCVGLFVVCVEQVLPNKHDRVLFCGTLKRCVEFFEQNKGLAK